MNKSNICLIILIFISTTGFCQTRLATSTLMIKTQMQTGSINPIQDGEMRFSGDYITIFWWLVDEFPIIFWWFSDDVLWFYDDFLWL